MKQFTQERAKENSTKVAGVMSGLVAIAMALFPQYAEPITKYGFIATTIAVALIPDKKAPANATPQKPPVTADDAVNRL